MTMSAVGAISALAELYASRREELEDRFSAFPRMQMGFDAVYEEIIFRSTMAAILYDSSGALSEALLAEDDLAPLADKSTIVQVSHPSGSASVQPETLGIGLLGAALARVYVFALRDDAPTLARLMLEGFDRLRQVLRGEDSAALQISGFVGVTLSADMLISTPWGSLSALPPTPRPDPGRRAEPATVMLARDVPIRATIRDRPAKGGRELWEPEEFGDAETHMAHVRLVPLACALASDDRAPSVPVSAWTLTLLPFSSGLGGSGAGEVRLRPQRDLEPIGGGVEEWARIVQQHHSPAVDLAVSRLISATAHRWDPADRLVDAVMVWENLVGSSNETVFKVTGALTKLLEPDRAKRREFQADLRKIYDLRSKVVHGVSVDARSVAAAADDAVSIAIRSLRECYRRGTAWLEMTSQDRARTLLLVE